MALAILSVLYPDKVTVYDIRVCDALGEFNDAKDNKNVKKMRERYSAYIEAVKSAMLQHLKLRDKYRVLWCKSFAMQLEKDIQSSFKHEGAVAEKMSQFD